MENPAPSIVVPPIAAPVSANFSRLAFRNLYIRRTGPDSREMVTVEGRRGSSDQTGDMRYVSDFPVYDGRGSDAVLVARVQGVTTTFGNSNQFFTVAFEAGRLKGSTLLTEGVVTDGSDEWAIYGGTGEFAMARGVVKRRYLADRDGAGNTDELSMQVFCPVFGSSQQPNKQLHVCRTPPSLSPRLGYGVAKEGRRRTSRRRSHRSACTASPFVPVPPSTPSSSRILTEVARGAPLGDGVDLAATFERSILATPRMSGRSQERTAHLKEPPR
ncbi:hypothetical protein ZEAMMB73_Zm00001d035559 [Zea mays]|uniref:Dirigent protein n=1 Tax=Zea mays TaxID=4577 RepID=A0A1D6LH80_MAIZE|nr:hypothetical protein ZEAMMB73_Zm00001d035559 [Zea mays]